MNAAALPSPTIPATILDRTRTCSTSMAVVDSLSDRRKTYAELDELIRRAAAAFVRAGLRPGDPVAIWAPNCLDWIVACAGTQMAGGVMVPLNTRFKGQEAQYILNRTRVRFLVVVGRFLGITYLDLL